MEIIDVLDRQGRLTGKTKAKDDVHRDGDWHQGTHVWVMNSRGELLIQRRALVKSSWPGLWDLSVGGHVAAGESSRVAAARELSEELGIHAVPEELEFLFRYAQRLITNGGAFINNEFEDVYLLQRDVELADLALQEEEVAEAKFVPWRELEAMDPVNDPSFIRDPEGYRRFFEILRERRS